MEYSSFMHEIKNSLSSIYGLCDLIKQQDDISDIREYADLIQKSIQTIKNTEADFDMYRTTGRNTLTYQIIDVSHLVQSIIKSNTSIINQYKIQVKSIYRKSRAYTDPNKLRQVITNLLTNACKYSYVGGTIEVCCYTKNNSAKIVIRDYGIGMSEEELINIGKPFYRSKRITRPGSGLGLGIVKKISELLHWDFRIVSSLGKGTKVEVIIPHIMGGNKK